MIDKFQLCDYRENYDASETTETVHLGASGG